MAKIPLGKTIESAYSFAFSNFLSVLGVMWLPSLLFGAAVVGAFLLALPDMAMPLDFHFRHGHDPETFRANLRTLIHGSFHMARFAGLIALVGLLARAMVTVGVMEKALGTREGPVFVYFSFGAPVWRMIGAMFLAVIVIVLGVLATCVAAGLAVWAAETYAPGIEGLVKVVAAVSAVCWIVYMSLRLVFFLPAVVVAEGRVGLGRAWELGGGNFWRIVGLLLAVLLPIGIVARIVTFALFGGMWEDGFRAALLHHAPHEVFMTMIQDIQHTWPLFLLFGIVYATLVTGLGIGAIGTAYKAVTAESAG